MKKLIVLITYNLGDLVSKIMDIPLFQGFTISNGLYKIYNYLMCKSIYLQDKWGLDGPWEKPEEGIKE